MFDVRNHNFGQVAVLCCSGRLVLGEDLSLLRRAVMSSLGGRIVVLDLDAIEAIDGSGVGLLVSLHNWTSDSHMEMKLMSPPRHLQEILELTGLQSVFDTWSCEDLAALLSDMAKPACTHQSQGGRAA